MELGCILKGDYKKIVQFFFKIFWKFIDTFFHLVLYLPGTDGESLTEKFPRAKKALTNYSTPSSRYHSWVTS